MEKEEVERAEIADSCDKVVVKEMVEEEAVDEDDDEEVVEVEMKEKKD